MSKRLGIIEDHDLFRSILRTAVEKHDDLEVAFDASDGPQALERLETLDVDMALVDLALVTRSGVALIAEIRRRWPHVICVVVCGSTSPLYLRNSFAAGAQAYILKGKLRELEAGIRAAFAGDTYISPAMRDIQ